MCQINVLMLTKYIDFSEMNTCNSTKIYKIDLTYGYIESQDQALIIHNIIMLHSNLHIYLLYLNILEAKT